MVEDRGGDGAGSIGFAAALRTSISHYVFDLWADQWRRRHARGDVILTRFADDYVAGFEHRDDAERFLADLRDRFAKFGLELHPEKTRLIEFGRYAAENRARRGDRKPETFEFLGFTHICAKTRNGRFKLKRVTSKKKMRAKLHAVKTEIRRRWHLPIPEQGRWLASVLPGHYRYYAVPDNIGRCKRSATAVMRHWLKALRRRSQRSRMTWERMRRFADRWLPLARIHASLARRRASTPEPKAGAQCVRRARWDLRGGRRATGVPTAIQAGSVDFPHLAFGVAGVCNGRLGGWRSGLLCATRVSLIFADPGGRSTMVRRGVPLSMGSSVARSPGLLIGRARVPARSGPRPTQPTEGNVSWLLGLFDLGDRPAEPR